MRDANVRPRWLLIVDGMGDVVGHACLPGKALRLPIRQCRSSSLRYCNPGSEGCGMGRKIWRALAKGRSNRNRLWGKWRGFWSMYILCTPSIWPSFLGPTGRPDTYLLKIT